MARVIKSSDIGTGWPGAGPLNVCDVAAQARAVVSAARSRAAETLRAARARARAGGISEVAAARRQGFEQGLSRGLDVGQERGASAGEELSRAADGLREIAAALTAARTELAGQMQRQALELAMLLTNKIVGLVAGQDIAAARHNLAKALELAGGGDVIVRVSPRQHRRLSEHCRELAETLGCGGVRVMADESITPGGVKVLCRGGEIDATIETQLANVAASLAGMGGLFTDETPAMPEMTESSTRP